MVLIIGLVRLKETQNMFLYKKKRNNCGISNNPYNNKCLHTFEFANYIEGKQIPNCHIVIPECPAPWVFSPPCSTGFIWILDGKEQRNHGRSDLSAAAALNISLRRALSSDIFWSMGKTLGKSCKILEETFFVFVLFFSAVVTLPWSLSLWAPLWLVPDMWGLGSQSCQEK